MKEARRTLGSGFTWICDAIDNPIKHALGNAPNSEFVVDGKGRLVRKRAWSDPAALRADLEELVGKVENPTDPADLELVQEAPPRAAGRALTPILRKLKPAVPALSLPAMVGPGLVAISATTRAAIKARLMCQLRIGVGIEERPSSTARAACSRDSSRKGAASS